MKRARLGGRYVADGGEFPLGKTGGLIEAWRMPLQPSSRTRRFPLGKTGGLIEAIRSALATVSTARVSAG